MRSKNFKVIFSLIMILQTVTMPVLIEAHTANFQSQYYESEYEINYVYELEIGEAVLGPLSESGTFPVLVMPNGITPHRPEVYVDGFPVVRIDMNNPFNWDVPASELTHIRENWQGAVLNVDNVIPEFAINNMNVTARGRGNSTWNWERTKRPLRFRFPNNQWRGMFDADYDGRDWILLANAIDRTHMRDFTARYFGDLLGSMYFVPDAWFVHLYLDGEYRGVYLMTDEREAGPGRANLTLDADPTISEYMIELDVWLTSGPNPSTSPVNTYWVQTDAGPFDIRHPSSGAWMDTPNNPHALYVYDFVNRVDRAILSGNRELIESMIDIETFIDFYLVQEVVNNQDVGGSSVFFTIRGQGDERRLYAGPLWDFDHSVGNTSACYNPLTRNGTWQRNRWFRSLLRTPWFREEVQARWLEVRDVELAETLDRISYVAISFEDEFQRDLDRWPAHMNRRGESPLTRGLPNFMAHAEHLHWYLTERAGWLTGFLEEDATPWRVSMRGGDVNGVAVTGQTMEISAHVPNGQQFVRWEVPNNVVLDNVYAQTATFIMPASDVTVRAIFEPIPVNSYDLTVIDGLGTGNFAERSSVLIYSAHREGYNFVRWESSIPVEFVDVNNRNTSIIMPSEDVTIRAIFERNSTRTLTVTDGFGSRNFEVGATAIAYAPPREGYRFVRWEVTGMNVNEIAYFNPYHRNPMFIMPNQDIALRAIYEQAPALTVADGFGSGNFASGSVVVAYAPLQTGHRFVRWEVTGMNANEIAYFNPYHRNPMFIMPNQDIALRAIYEQVSELTVIEGFGEGIFVTGSTAIAYAPSRVGHRFVRWEVTGMDVNEIAYFNPYHRNPMFIMPNQDITLRAIYEQAPELRVVDGFGTGNLASGSVAIAYAPPRAGQRFVRWEVVGMDANQIAYFNPYHHNPMFIMPNQDITLRAIFAAN